MGWPGVRSKHGESAAGDTLDDIPGDLPEQSIVSYYMNLVVNVDGKA